MRNATDASRVYIGLRFIHHFSTIDTQEVVFTVEYSIRSAQIAVYTLLKLDRKVTPMYKTHDPRVLLEALKALHR